MYVIEEMGKCKMAVERTVKTQAIQYSRSSEERGRKSERSESGLRLAIQLYDLVRVSHAKRSAAASIRTP